MRQIIRGPTLYAPKPNEWIHEFTWHGEDGAHKTHIIPGAKKFQKLRLIPDQFYYNITDVRTADDALITVKLMVFFELVNVETMLNNTHDPIADFVSHRILLSLSHYPIHWHLVIDQCDLCRCYCLCIRSKIRNLLGKCQSVKSIGKLSSIGHTIGNSGISYQ